MLLDVELDGPALVPEGARTHSVSCILGEMSDEGYAMPASALPRPLFAAFLVLLVVTVFGLGTPTAETKPDDDSAADARSRLEAAEDGLLQDPTDPTLLARASRAAEEAGAADEALWYARLALHEARAEGRSEEEIEDLVARVAALDPLPVDARPRLAERSRRLFELGVECAKRKLYANAVEYFERCHGTPAEPEAAEQLAKLYANKKSVAALLDTGLDVPIHHRTSRADRRRVRQDAGHENWRDAWRVKSTSYTVHTNVGWSVGTGISRAMEQMNRFYRETYLGKRGSGKTSRCTIDVYRSRTEFIEHTGNSSALGLYFPGQNRVAAFDPRADGGTLRELYETLFHETSHQFTHLVCRSTIPSWLNEGLATYFESARILAGGRVVPNLPNKGRLTNLQQTLNDGDPTVRDVVSYSEPGSYPAEYYCVGWGLTYFFKNYENEKSERVYAPHFDAYLKSYKSTGKHDSFARFVEYFVERPKEEGLDSFDSLVRRFKTWIDELHLLVQGGSEKADDLLERARRQRKAGRTEAALESYRWALDKRRGDPAALFDLAALHVKRKEKDAALYRLRRLLAQMAETNERDENVRGLDMRPDEVAEKCRAGIDKLEKTLLPAETAIHQDFVTQITEAAQAYVAAGYPRNALWSLDTAILILGGDGTLAKERARIADEKQVETWRWRRVPITTRFRAWHPLGPWGAEEGALTITTEEMLENVMREEPGPRYRFEATVHLTEPSSNTYAGILFGHAGDGVWDVFVLTDRGRVEVNRIIEDWPMNRYRGRYQDHEEDGVRLAVEVDRGTVRFFVDGRRVETRAYPQEELAGRVGVMAKSAVARFEDVRLGN